MWLLDRGPTATELHVGRMLHGSKGDAWHGLRPASLLTGNANTPNVPGVKGSTQDLHTAATVDGCEAAESARERGE